MFAAGVVPSVIFFLLLLRAPETPRYLFLVGREGEGLAILERIAGHASAESEAAEIRASLAEKLHAWLDLLRPGIRRPLVVGFVLAILVHLSGINTIIDYAPAILRSAGWKLDAALFSTFIVGLSNLVFTLVSFWVIDCYGRKPLYIAGSLGMAAALTLLAATVAAGRFQGTVVLFFPYAFNQIGKDVTFGFLAVMAIAQAAVTWLWVPETKYKTLEEIEKAWEGDTRELRLPLPPNEGAAFRLARAHPASRSLRAGAVSHLTGGWRLPRSNDSGPSR